MSDDSRKPPEGTRPLPEEQHVSEAITPESREDAFRVAIATTGCVGVAIIAAVAVLALVLFAREIGQD